MSSGIFETTFIVGVLAGMVRVATPVLFAALGELFTERSGVLNLGVEGCMLMGGFMGFLVAFMTDSLWAGVAASMVGGAAMGLIMAFMSSTLKVDQIVTGLSLNLFASGITFYWYRVVFRSSEIVNVPTIAPFRPVKIPILSEIPYLGELLFSQYALTYIVLIMVPATWFLLYRTKVGLHLRCLGENPRVLDMRGVNVTRLQYQGVIFGCMLAGLGGGFLTMVSVGLFVPGITAGRGWLALVIVIAGNWKPQRILGAALVFGFLESLQANLQGFGEGLPYQIFLALPYIVAIILLISGRTRSEAPLSLGMPYIRE